MYQVFCSAFSVCLSVCLTHTHKTHAHNSAAHVYFKCNTELAHLHKQQQERTHFVPLAISTDSLLLIHGLLASIVFFFCYALAVHSIRITSSLPLYLSLSSVIQLSSKGFFFFMTKCSRSLHFHSLLEQLIHFVPNIHACTLLT